MTDRSPLNKTISTPLSEGAEYLSRCVRLTEPVADVGEIVNSTIIGDCLRIAPLLPPGSVDLLIADPPYNLTKRYDTGLFTKKGRDEYERYTREWLRAVCPLLRDDASVYVCCDWGSSLIVGSVLGEYLKIRNRITWQREKGRGSAKNWKNGLEDVWFATKSDDYHFDLSAVRMRRKVNAPYRESGSPKDWFETEGGKYRDTCPSNFWDDITIPFWSMAENTEHPTQKPEKLFAKLILASSQPGDLVLDPFLGSGTTSVVAKKLGRRYIGIEKSEQYCLWAEQRLEAADTDKTIQGYRDGIFYERNSG